MSFIRVLLVEDNFSNRVAFEELVKQDRLPYDYAIASSVAEAGKILTQDNFDIAILNCDLGDGTALDLLPTLSARQIPVVLKAPIGKEEALIPLMRQNQNVRNCLIEDTDRRYLKLLPIAIQKVLEDVQTQTHLQKLQTQADRARQMTEEDLQTLVEGAAAVTGENFFPALAEYIAAALGVRYVLISKSQGDYFQTYAFWVDGQLQPNISGSLFNTPCGLSIAEGTYFCTDRVQQKFPGNKNLVAMGVDSYVGIALTNTKGEVIGSLCALDDKPLTQKQRTISMLRVFAARVSAELERQEAIDALHQLNQDLETRVEQRTAQLQQAIVERQQAEEQLRSLSDRLTLAISSGAFGIWEYDIIRDTNIWDDRMYELYGVSPTDFSGTYTEWLNRLHPDDRAAVNEISQQVLLGNKEYNIEFRVIHPNGEIRFLKAYGTVQRNQQGEPQRLIGVNFDITDRKQMEEALRYSEERFQIALKNSQIVVFNQDLDLRYIWIYNPALGYNPAQVLGKFDRDLFLPEDAEKLEKLKRNVLATGKGIREEVTLADRANIKCYVLAIDPLHDRNGNLEGVTCAALDITQQKQIELTLQQQLEKEKLLVSVLQRIQDSLDFQEILNQAVDEVRKIIQADRVLVYQVFPDRTGKAVAESAIDPWEKIRNFTFPAETFSQTYYQSYIEGNIYLINDRDRDLVLDSMMQFMQKFQICAQLVVPIVQQKNEQLWGWLIAHQCSQSRRWESWEMTLLQQLAGQLAVAIDRSNLYCQLQVELNERKQAEADLYEANERLQIVNTELARATRLKDEFLANMSHELRTPLNAILGLSEGLLKEVFGSLNEKQKKYLSIIDRSGQHLLDLINDILDLAKIEAGKIELELTYISLNYLCESCLPFVKQQALKKRILIETDVPANLAIIEGDERRLKQVLINLLSNAIKFTPEGGCVRLEVRTDVMVEIVAIRIIDTGIGIASEDMDKLFKAFSQIDSSLSRQHEGTGLGLALVQRIVSLHSGSVTVESKVGQGSCFTVKLPFHQGIKPLISKSETYPDLASEMKLLQTQVGTVEGGADRKNIKETVTMNNVFCDCNEQLEITFPPSISSDTSTEKPLVLLAEDNQINLLMLSECLKNMGYRVIVASNGIEAVEKAKLHLPAIVIMDIQMPQMNGLEATRQIHADNAKIPIFALTALAMPEDREKCLEAGMVEYLTKPINLKQLIVLMETHIDRGVIVRECTLPKL